MTTKDSTKRGDGGTAFPSHEHFIAEHGGERKVMTGQPHGGMSLRDYFAARALPVVLAAVDNQNKLAWHEWAVQCSKVAYEIADAMLAERAK